MKRAVIYHAKCNDGVTAAAIALTRFEVQNPDSGEDVGVFACNYGYDFPKEIPLGCHEVYIVDFSFPPDVMMEVADRMPSTQFWILDHHASAIEKYDDYVMPANVHLKFATGPGVSGASIAWDFFFPDAEWVPDLVLDVADRDTWVFSRPNTKAIHQALLSMGENRKPEYVMDYFLCSQQERGEKYSELVSVGGQLLNAYNAALKEIHGSAFYRQFKTMGPYKDLQVCLVNCPYQYISDMAEYVRQNDDRWTEDMLFIGFVVRKNGVSLSFRSETGIAKPVAESYGGGGHPDSAGANVTYGTLIDLLTTGERIPDLGHRTHYLVVPAAYFPDTEEDIQSKAEDVVLDDVTHLLFSLEYAKGRPQKYSKLVELASFVFYFEDNVLRTDKMRDHKHVKRVGERVRAYASNTSKESSRDSV